MISKLSDTVSALHGHIEGQQAVIASLTERIDQGELKQTHDHQQHQAVCAQQERRLQTQQHTIADLTAQLKHCNKTQSKNEKRLDDMSVQQAKDAKVRTALAQQQETIRELTARLENVEVKQAKDTYVQSLQRAMASRVKRTMRGETPMFS